MLTEGRKFGFRLLMASQYPDRLATELRAAAAGTVREVVAFRTPPASAAEVGGWLGLARPTAEASLPGLPAGIGICRSHPAGDLIAVVPEPGPPPDETAWKAVVAASHDEFRRGPTSASEPALEDVATERILLAVLGAEEERAPLAVEEIVGAAARLPGLSVDPAIVGDRARELERRGLLRTTEGTVLLTRAGARALGLSTETGATRETSEHRALLVRAFRLFARRGYRLEIVRQGRYDTTLPDARFRQLPGPAARSPRALAAALAELQGGWAWRFFGGRDVDVEAEVSGALRSERIRRGVEKALKHDAFPLFVVGDARRARKVRRTLRELGLGPDRAQVWTLSDPYGGTGTPGT